MVSVSSRVDEQDSNIGGATVSLAKLWAKKYVKNLGVQPETEDETRSAIANRLLQSLRSNSAQAWTKTENFLAQEVLRQGIDRNLIDPWAISKDVHEICEKALSAYVEEITPNRLSVLVAEDIGKIRHKYTTPDPRVIGFVSMQLYNTREYLLETLSPQEKVVVAEYFKVIDDQLYMPLNRAYNAAAQHSYDSPAIAVVQKVLPVSSEIARNICRRVLELYPAYECYNGALENARLQTSSIRDVEMFQIYLWVCVLEGNIEAIQQELFPICVMLYPLLKVKWKLVQEMIHLMGDEIRFYVGKEDEAIFHPYFHALMDMFSPDVFPDMA